MIDVLEQIKNLEAKKRWCLKKGYANYVKLIDEKIEKLKSAL